MHMTIELANLKPMEKSGHTSSMYTRKIGKRRGIRNGRR